MHLELSVSPEPGGLEMTLCLCPQTSGYLFRRQARQCALLGEGRVAQALAPAHEDKEGVHGL